MIRRDTPKSNARGDHVRPRRCRLRSKKRESPCFSCGECQIARYIKDMIGFDSVVEPQQSIFRLRIHGALKVMAVMDHLYAGNETLSLERKYKQYRSFVDGFILRKRHLRTLYGAEA